MEAWSTRGVEARCRRRGRTEGHGALEALKACRPRGMEEWRSWSCAASVAMEAEKVIDGGELEAGRRKRLQQKAR